MRVLIVGSDKVYAIENHYYKHLKDIGEEVFLFPSQTIFMDYYQRGILFKIAYKLGVSGIYKLINKEIKLKVEELKPDLVWIFKGMEVFPATLQWIKSRGIKLVNYNPDNPFIFSGKGSGNRNVTDSIQLYDLHFTYNLQVKKKLEEDYKTAVEFLPFGFEPYNKLDPAGPGNEEIVKACFIGNPDSGRADFIRTLADRGIKFDVYGNGWTKFLRHDNISLHEAVLGDSLWTTMWKYRLQLNLMRVHNDQGHNMRTFEVPGIGGILLAPETPEHLMFFEPYREAYFFKDVADCVEKINDLLKLPSSAAQQLRNHALERSIKSGYDYRSRTIQVANSIKKLVCQK